MPAIIISITLTHYTPIPEAPTRNHLAQWPNL